MGTGIRIDRPFSLKNWSNPLRLISIAMAGFIILSTLIGYFYLQLPLPSALLLAAALAPTDPVLASDVQVGAPNEKVKSETKFSLTAEAGLNDGMAFPFVWMAIILAQTPSSALDFHVFLSWLVDHFLFKIGAGVLLGYLFGRVIGYLIFSLSAKYSALHTRDGFLAVSLTLIVYSVTEMIHGYGFIAVFICAITLRHFDKKHGYHHDLYSFVEQTERLLVAVLLLLFGGTLVNGALNPLTWKMALFSLILVIIIRPLTAYISLLGINAHLKERLAISFFGIRGMGSVFYLAFAFTEVAFYERKELWAIVSFTIILSILLHGITATPVINHLKREIKEEQIPE